MYIPLYKSLGHICPNGIEIYMDRQLDETEIDQILNEPFQNLYIYDNKLDLFSECHY